MADKKKKTSKTGRQIVLGFSGACANEMAHDLKLRLANFIKRGVVIRTTQVRKKLVHLGVEVREWRIIIHFRSREAAQKAWYMLNEFSMATRVWLEEFCINKRAFA